MARACLTFLSFDDFKNKPTEIWRREQVDGYRIPCYKAFPDNPYHFTFYAVLSWGFHAQRADETEEVKVAAIDFLSRPANVAYNWLVIMIVQSWTCVGKRVAACDGKYLLYEDLLKDAQLFRLLLPVHVGLKDFLVELLKRHTRPAENALDTVISRLAGYAAWFEHRDIVRLLLTKKDVDWNVSAWNGKELVTQIAGWNDEDTLRTLLQKESCSVDALTGMGSALHLAVRNGFTSIARMLLEAGADVEALNKQHNPVIITALTRIIGERTWDWEMIDLLLEYKADVNAHGENGNTALHYAHWSGTKAIVYLVSKGANLNLRNELGQTPLDSAIFERAAESIKTLQTAGGKTAIGMFIDEHGSSIPPEWLEKLKKNQERRNRGGYW